MTPRQSEIKTYQKANAKLQNEIEQMPKQSKGRVVAIWSAILLANVIGLVLLLTVPVTALWLNPLINLIVPGLLLLACYAGQVISDIRIGRLKKKITAAQNAEDKQRLTTELENLISLDTWNGLSGGLGIPFLVNLAAGNTLILLPKAALFVPIAQVVIALVCTVFEFLYVYASKKANQEKIKENNDAITALQNKDTERGTTAGLRNALEVNGSPSNCVLTPPSPETHIPAPLPPSPTSDHANDPLITSAPARRLS